MVQQIFVNLAVKDVDAATDFFGSLGFSFDKRFSDQNAACLIIGDNIYAMLLGREFFSGFIPGKTITDTAKQAEALMGITAESRQEVDDMIDKVVAAGGKEYREPSDHGWMYSRAFEDLDGHIWEVFFMDMDKLPEEMKQRGE